MEDKTVQVTAYVLADLHVRLASMAKADSRSISYMVTRAIRELVERGASEDGERVLAPGGMPTSPYQSNIGPTPHESIMKTARAQAAAVKDTAVHPGRQVDLEDAIVAAVKRGPSKPAKHK